MATEKGRNGYHVKPLAPGLRRLDLYSGGLAMQSGLDLICLGRAELGVKGKCLASGIQLLSGDQRFSVKPLWLTCAFLPGGRGGGLHLLGAEGAAGSSGRGSCRVAGNCPQPRTARASSVRLLRCRSPARPPGRLCGCPLVCEGCKWPVILWSHLRIRPAGDAVRAASRPYSAYAARCRHLRRARAAVGCARGKETS